MRPIIGDDAWTAHQRQHAPGRRDRDAHLTAHSSSNSHMSFCMADEASLDTYPGRAVFLPPPFEDSRKGTEPSQLRDRDHMAEENAPSFSPFSRASFLSQSSVSLVSQAQPTSESRPITPMMLGHSCVGSTASSSSSRRSSFASSLSDHVVSHEGEFAGEVASAPSMLDSGSAPQLVMPSINMPSRRPFTEAGRNLGRLKILLAGQSGVGKTSLLKAIVQTCDHIVHVDPISPPNDLSKAFSRPGMAALPTREPVSTATISEVYASTKPYPEWWQELDTPSVPHKRKRRGDSVLERNICFVDTPGYGRESSVMETIMSCVDYVESHLSKLSSDDLNDSELTSMLGGDGGCQVDVVLYLISHDLKPADLEYLRRLVPLTNVIPILARADVLSEEQTMACKQEIARQLEDAGLRPFTFTPAMSREKGDSFTPPIPYTASSTTASDHDIMDASLLMSPEYVQPLIPTDLAFLVAKMFSPDGASWLRHSVARKFVQWREVRPRRPRGLYRPLDPPVPDFSSGLTQQLSLALARCSSSQQSHGAGRVQLASWAAELQRSLASERLRYEALPRGERAVWLTEKLHECVQDGTLVAVNGAREADSGGRRRSQRKETGRYGALETHQHQDPLGLLQVVADLKARGWMAVEVLSSLGLVGLVFWISKYGWPKKATELMDGWVKF
ncbi:hypothetical protein F4802DRAFT_588830 [Xylaria palmicola]|nr:hypothetical protein F4802DRAFT_588830 [Xylaria palmicola]